MFDAWITANAETLQFALFFGLFAVFALLEPLAPKRPGPMRRGQRWATNLALTAINAGVLALLPVTFLGAALWAQQRGLGLLNAVAPPTAILILGTLAARGFISFFTHYLMHTVPWFWRVHRVHHLDTELDVSTTVRGHPLEFAIGLVPGVALVVLFGLTPWVLLLYEVLDAGVNVFTHSNIRVPRWLDRALRYVIVTPDLHRVHHSAWKTETDSNFGAVFPIWDIVFGTFRTETRVPQETMTLGLSEVRDRRAHGLWWLLTSPVRSLRVGAARDDLRHAAPSR